MHPVAPNPAPHVYNVRGAGRWHYGEHERLDPGVPGKTIFARHVSVWGPWRPRKKRGKIVDPLRGGLWKPWVIESVQNEKLGLVRVYIRGVAWTVKLAQRRVPAGVQDYAAELLRISRGYAELERPDDGPAW